MMIVSKVDAEHNNLPNDGHNKSARKVAVNLLGREATHSDYQPFKVMV